MSKTIGILLVVVGLTLSSGCTAQDEQKDSTTTPAPTAPAPTTTVSTGDTTKQEPFFVDVRTPQEFAEGSVPGAVNIPLDQVESRIEEFKGKEEIVVFCRSGNRSSQAKAILEANGIRNVNNGGSWMDVKEDYKK